MAATIDKKTKERSADYMLGDWTYDEVLQFLRKHYRRSDDFKGLSKKGFRKRLKTRLGYRHPITHLEK